MAASYSSFLSTRFYSSAFNTALFDGPFRIYFSQSYESAALKIYHLLQSDHLELWTSYKRWTEQTKKHAFILMYPTQKELSAAFKKSDSKVDFKIEPICQPWEDGVLVGLDNPQTDADFEKYFAQIVLELKKFSETFSSEVFQREISQ